MTETRKDKLQIMLDATFKYVPTTYNSEIRALEITVEDLGEENL